jgi:hypothetical protein
VNFKEHLSFKKKKKKKKRPHMFQVVKALPSSSCLVFGKDPFRPSVGALPILDYESSLGLRRLPKE